VFCTLLAAPFTYFESCLRRGPIVTYYSIKKEPKDVEQKGLESVLNRTPSKILLYGPD
jgi:hypothetical protein